MAARKTTKKAKAEKAKENKTPVATPEKTPAQTAPVQSTSTEKSSKPGFRKAPIIILLILVILGFAFYFLRKWLVVAEVNGQPISRMEFNHLMEMQSGEQVLNELVAKKLILQEANNKHITVSDAEVNSRVSKFQKSLAKQGKTLDQYLASRPMSKQDFLDEVKIEVVLEKLLAKDIAVSDKEVNDYIAQNKDNIPANSNMNDVKDQVKQQLTQQKLQEKLPVLIQSLQKKAKISRPSTF